jgi:hypothetical protein
MSSNYFTISTAKKDFCRLGEIFVKTGQKSLASVNNINCTLICSIKTQKRSLISSRRPNQRFPLAHPLSHSFCFLRPCSTSVQRPLDEILHGAEPPLQVRAQCVAHQDWNLAIFVFAVVVNPFYFFDVIGRCP